MSFKVFFASYIVVASGEGGINSDSLGFGVNFELNTSDAVISAHCVKFRPG